MVHKHGDGEAGSPIKPVVRVRTTGEGVVILAACDHYETQVYSWRWAWSNNCCLDDRFSSLLRTDNGDLNSNIQGCCVGEA